jgi:prophage regulatory protein
MSETERQRLGLGPEDPLDLVGTAEIAEMLGVSRQHAYNISEKRGFPWPVAELKAGRFWLRSEVQAWKDESYKGGRK